jgi:hypothetical protein
MILIGKICSMSAYIYSLLPKNLLDLFAKFGWFGQTRILYFGVYLDTALEMDSMDDFFVLVRIRHRDTLRLVIQWWIDFIL